MQLHFEPAKHHKQKIKRLFLSAFPKEERPPIGLLYRRERQGKAHFYAIMEGETFVGLALMCGSKNIKTLMFFAIEESLRGKGYGGQVLQMLKEEYKNVPFFLCAEPLDEKANNAKERVNRLRFYAHNGFEEVGLIVREAGVDYTVLTPGYPLTYAQYKEAALAFFGKLRWKFIITRF